MKTFFPASLQLTVIGSSVDIWKQDGLTKRPLMMDTAAHGPAQSIVHQVQLYVDYKHK